MTLKQNRSVEEYTRQFEEVMQGIPNYLEEGMIHRYTFGLK